ncbi:hypothetical protein CPB85DRAFT_1284294 [Mucidula mucida]|nr:hypothetical protein CPB85DRAFT_1284294 [Mucidula mucida]
MAEQAIPFPASGSVDLPPVTDEPKSSSEPALQTSQTFISVAESSNTDSSKLTSSDKLTALPSTPNLNKTNRSPGSNARGFRRSLETNNSLPSIHSTGELNALGLQWHSHSSPKIPPRSSVSNEGLETPRGRVSIESDRVSAPTLQSVKQAFSTRLNRASDSGYPSPGQRTEQLRGDRSPSNNSPNPSRATSPLRFLQQWSQGLHRPHNHREEPFVPIDPFHLNWQCNIPSFSCPCCCCIVDTETDTAYDCDHFRKQATGFGDFITDTLPRMFYLYTLLRLPALYFSRVARIFEDADVSRPDIQRMIDTCSRPGYNMPLSSNVNVNANAARHATSTGVGLMGHVGAVPLVSDLDVPITFPEDWAAPFVSPALVRFKHSWEAFIDSLLREWKTLNVVSALLLSAILTMFQIPNAASDPLTRTAALLSLICALWSLSFGCIYIVRFGTMRTMYRASRWAEEARKNDTVIWWNVWVMLAMPSVWMSWSMILFIVSILSFVWRTGSVDDPDERAPLVYFFLIVRTLKSYGSHWVLNGRRQVTMEQTRVDPEPAPEVRRGRERERERRSDDPPSDTFAINLTDSPEQKTMKLGGDVTEMEVPGQRDGRLRSMLGLSREPSRVEPDVERGTGPGPALERKTAE